MSDINKIFLYEEFIKKCEKITLVGWDKKIPTKLNKFTLENGTLDTRIVGGVNKPNNRILII